MVKIKSLKRDFIKNEKINIFFKLIFFYFALKRSKSNSFYQKKGISPVVTTVLLLSVAVVSFIGLQSWFSDFSSNNLIFKYNLNRDSLTIEGVKSNILYVKNRVIDNLSISELKIGNNSCNITGQENLRLGINFINISLCTINLKSHFQSIKILTKAKIIERNLYLNDVGLNCSTLSLNGGNWITVPGNPILGTSDFCVMKYEAKWNGSGTINNTENAYCGNGNNYNISTGCIDDTEGVTSQANSLPLRNVNHFEAIELCSRLGSNFHLVTDAEWVTIARNIEQVDVNWDSGTAYIGSLKRGNTGDIVAGVAYNGADPADRSEDTNTLALLYLSNGEGIWDFSGNLWEWTSDTLPTSGVLNSSLGQGTGEGWVEWNPTISISYNYLKPFNASLTSTNGIGKVYYNGGFSSPNNATWNTTHAFLRGGSWADGANAGAFALFLNRGPSSTSTNIGFRCSYAP